MPDLRWAVLGAGRIGLGVLPRIADAEGCRVVAIASRHPLRAADAARASGRVSGDSTRAGCSYEDLLERDDVDAVYVALPNHLHFEWCRRLLEAGKHVLCEKPLAARGHEAEVLAAAAARNAHILTEGFMWLHHPQSARLLELARLGDGSPIGRLRAIRSERNVRTTDPHILSTRLSHAMQGGALMDIGCYPVSAALWLTGEEPRWDTLRAAATLADALPGETGRVDDTISFAWDFPSGVRFEAEASFSKGTGVFLELIGERGSARTTFPYSPDPIRQSLIVNEREEIFEHGGERFTNQFAHFARAVRAEATSLPTAEWSVVQARTIEAIRLAAGVGFPGD